MKNFNKERREIEEYISKHKPTQSSWQEWKDKMIERERKVHQNRLAFLGKFL